MFGVFADIKKDRFCTGNRLQTPRRTGSKGKETQNPESFEKSAPNPSRNAAMAYYMDDSGTSVISGRMLSCGKTGMLSVCLRKM